MGGAEAKETAETESGVAMSDDDFEELASSAGIETHDDGDVVDTEGLAEGNKVKITKKQLRQIIKEELSNTVNESVTDMTAMDDIIRKHVGPIIDAFGEAMESLWEEDTAMMKRQGYTNESQWYSQVGRAELALEQRLQEDIAKAIQEVEMELHDGGYYQDDAFGPGADRDNDGALDADELRSIANDLEG